MLRPQAVIAPDLIVLAVAVVVATVVAVVRFVQYCLQDLAKTPDYQLRVFTRQGWTALIILWIPLGGLAYLSFGKWQ